MYIYLEPVKLLVGQISRPLWPWRLGLMEIFEPVKLLVGQMCQEL